MTLKLPSLFLAGLALALAPAAGRAAPVTVASDPGTTYTTAGLTGFSTFGDMMDGMSVTAHFVGGSSETVAWADVAAGAGGATGTGWSLTEAGDTFSSSWILTNMTGLGLTRLVLDGAPGRTVFDRTNPSPGTPGSASGLDFDELVASALTITATYRDAVAVGMAAPVGDLYRVLDVEFLTAGGLPTATTFTFEADTDNGSTEVVIQQVPEPVGLVLLGAGFAGAAGWRRLRRRAA